MQRPLWLEKENFDKIKDNPASFFAKDTLRRYQNREPGNHVRKVVRPAAPGARFNARMPS